MVNALHCDVCSLCMPSGVHGCLFHWFLGQCFLVEGHPYMTCFCTFWQSAFSVTCTTIEAIIRAISVHTPPPTQQNSGI